MIPSKQIEARAKPAELAPQACFLRLRKGANYRSRSAFFGRIRSPSSGSSAITGRSCSLRFSSTFSSFSRRVFSASSASFGKGAVISVRAFSSCSVVWASCDRALAKCSVIFSSALSIRVTLPPASAPSTAVWDSLPLSMEKKGIISDRCELNRQIKADNALLRELKAAVKKLAQEVLHSLPELAKSMEFLRQKLLIFCYQLNHIRTGKSVIGKSVDAWNINLNRYSEVVDQIKETKRERTDLLAEKKELPFWNIPRKNELTARIAELTELLEELQSEKAILLDNMDCTDGKDVSKVRKKVALMEANLKELDEQEQKYSAELETALAEYAELKTQGEQFDPVELHDTRQELRPEMEQTAVQRVKEKYGDKYSHRTMDDSKRDVSRHLDEYAESQEIRQIQREREYQQRRQNKAKQERKKQDDWER